MPGGPVGGFTPQRHAPPLHDERILPGESTMQANSMRQSAKSAFQIPSYPLHDPGYDWSGGFIGEVE
jgi:hypothetical protein